MSGSFLPNLWSSCNQSVRSREPTLLCNQVDFGARDLSAVSSRVWNTRILWLRLSANERERHARSTRNRSAARPQMLPLRSPQQAVRFVASAELVPCENSQLKGRPPAHCSGQITAGRKKL